MVTRSIEYKKAIIVSQERMIQLDSILAKNFDKIRYTAILKNGSQETHEIVESLLLSDNYNDERIVAIEVYAHNTDYNNDDSTYLYFGSKEYVSLLFEYSEVCKGNFSFSQKEKAKRFEEELNTLIGKSTAPYWVFAKFNLQVVLFLGCFIAYIYLLTHTDNNTQIINITMSKLMLLLLAAIAVVWLVFRVNRFIHETILPPVVFIWGEEVPRSKRMDRWRTNLFWVVIVGLVLMIGGQKIIELIY